jgi:hypothetical protein
MKRLLVWASIALALYGCSKSSGGATTSSPSEWSLNSTNYKGDSAVYNATSGLGVLTSADAAGNTITVIFYSHPTANGTYTVTGEGGTSAGLYCEINVQTYTPGTSTIYISTGKSGDEVDVTVSGGKITASFKDITVAYGSTTATSSGNVVQ